MATEREATAAGSLIETVNVVVHPGGLENDFVQPQDSAATALFRDPVEGRSAISDQRLFNHVVKRTSALLIHSLVLKRPGQHFMRRCESTAPFAPADGWSNLGLMRVLACDHDDPWIGSICFHGGGQH
ncbi:MAG: hypothetical protein QF785_06355 [Phycisphaeraceae bacterium]|nr:hypothetical protein [Phycisphaeraceae bacterium]MDP7346755.1 hypothetical protein [Phycisphaeraceae bacterium]